MIIISFKKTCKLNPKIGIQNGLIKLRINIVIENNRKFLGIKSDIIL